MSESFCDAGAFNRTPATSGLASTSAAPVIEEVSYYNMSGAKYLIIFNHYKFKNTKYFHGKCPPSRTGTGQDVNSLHKIFMKMGYKVNCYDDFEYSQIIEVILKISKQDHKGTSCLCFAFLTHGQQSGDIFAADRPYQFRDVTVLLENGHQSLVGKPKIFFVQACRGNQVDDGRRVEIDGSEASFVIPSQSDFFVLYSSVEDYVSFRDIEGSFMIQELCNVIEEYHEKWDILHIVTLVHRRVAYYRQTYAPSKKSIHDKKQMPETRFSLTKLFKF